MANVKSKSRLRVGKYGVELKAFDNLILSELERPTTDVDLHVIDEIGKMELFSNTFVETVRRILDGDVPLLATVALKGSGFVSEVKQRPGVELIRVTGDNRDSLPIDLAKRISDG